MKQIKILHFIPSLRSGGMERQLVELLKAFKDKQAFSHELVILSPNIHYNIISKFDVPITIFERRSKRDIIIFWKFFRYCFKSKPNIVHSWNSMCSVYALPSVKFLRIKFVNGFLRDVPPNFNIRNKDWIRSKLTFPFSDKIVSNTKSGLQAYKAPYRKSTYIYNGFDFKRLNTQKKRDIKNQLNITTEIVVGMVASFSDRKDHLTFLNSALKILKTRDDVGFILIGDGKFFNYYNNLFKGLFDDRIIFLGKLEKVETIINILDIGVLTSNILLHGEGISNSLMEYMSIGIPVIATNCKGNRELITNNVNGYVVDPFDSDAIVKKIVFLLENRKFAQTLGKRAKDTIKNGFSIEKMIFQYSKLYKETFSGKTVEIIL